MFHFSDTTDVNQPPSYNEGSPIPPNFEPTDYDHIMLDVDDILPSTLTPPVLAPPVPKPVCKLQTPALFTMIHASPRPQSLDAPNYELRVNHLPSPATSSSFSGELPLFIGSNSDSLTVVAGSLSLSLELLLPGQQPPPLRPQQSSFWAVEVVTEQTNRWTPETMVVPNCTKSGRVWGISSRSQPLAYSSTQMPKPPSYSSETRMPISRYRAPNSASAKARATPSVPKTHLQG